MTYEFAVEGTDPASGAPDDGVEGNARLTGANGLLLTLLLAVEGLTVLRIRELITVHTFVGLVLVTPVGLKISTTSYRFVRYYLHGQAYVRRGPPQLLLRILAPLLVLASVVLLGSGIVLIARKPGDAGPFLTIHKASFIVWGALMVVHFLGHIAESLRLGVRDWKPAAAARVPRGRGARRWLLVLTLVAGVGLAAVVTPVSSWNSGLPKHDRHHAG